MKKTKWFLLGLLTMLVMMPVKAEVQELGYVQAFKNAGEEVEVLDPTAENVVVTFNKVDLKWSEASEELGRDEGWWMGFKITAPTDMKNEESLKQAKFYREGLSEPKIIWDSMEDEEKETFSFGAWRRIDETTLKGKNEVFAIGTWEFDWDGDGDPDQTVTIKVNPSEEIKFQDPYPDKYVKINVGDKMVFTIAKNATLSTISETEKKYLQEFITPAEGYKFVGLFMTVGEEEVLVDIEETPFAESTVLTIKFEPIPVEKPSPSTPVDDKKDIVVEKEIKGDENVSLSSDASDILKDSLIQTSDEELKGLLEKYDVTIALETKKITKDSLLKEELEKFEKVVEGANVTEFFDLNIVVKVAGQSDHYLKELNKPITLSVALPELPELAKGYNRKYYILREHDGAIDKIDATVSQDGKSLSFASYKFSKYAIAYVDEEVKDEEIDKNPSTIDSIVSYVLLAFTSIGLLGITSTKVIKK